MCAPGQPTKSQCVSDKLASCGVIEGSVRAVAAQKLATETHAAAAVQAKIDENVAEELKKYAPSKPPAGCTA